LRVTKTTLRTQPLGSTSHFTEMVHLGIPGSVHIVVPLIYLRATSLGHRLQKLQDLRFILANGNFPLVPVNNLGRKLITDSLLFKQIFQLTNGRLNSSASCFNFAIASALSRAPEMIWPALCPPTYSSILLSWSPVGGPSWMSRVNSGCASLPGTG
jgi:hypothetical protein